MEAEIIERAKRLIDLQEDVHKKRERLQNLQSEMFGNGSEETEKKAREFFSSVADDQDNSGKTQKIDELRSSLSESEDELETTREELQKSLVDVKFPLNETIDATENGVEFPYSDEIPQEVIEAIEMALEEDLSGDPVSIDTDAVRVETADVDEAMDLAMDRIEGLRSKANMMVDVEQYVEDLHDRDEKIIRTLYVLQQSGESLTKGELENQIGVESGELRGSLYYVLDNDPYLQKSDSQFSLTDMGERVIEAYCEHYGAPDLPEEVEA
ncbi:hypothetical protein [Halobacterium rubrum]|uniref:hypothetical protein n=1 Tax=Halobacterium TaxID=2239 RepID=UPI001F4558CB|nr:MULTISPECIES: hypothetical protein [Halobacterium]MDH5020354.1 hypothetical protein [Halobacterium rubrum]